MNKLSICQIVDYTTVDGPGFRTTIYAAGCAHQCPGCHNPATWNYENGQMMSPEEVLRHVEENVFSDVTFSGGDPLFQPEAFSRLAKLIKEQTAKNIWCYTGFLFENVMNNSRLQQVLPYIDVLVDGPFVAKLKQEDLRFKGSSNQRIIDVQKSLIKGEAICLAL